MTANGRWHLDKHTEQVFLLSWASASHRLRTGPQHCGPANRQHFPHRCRFTYHLYRRSWQGQDLHNQQRQPWELQFTKSRHICTITRQPNEQRAVPKRPQNTSTVWGGTDEMEGPSDMQEQLTGGENLGALTAASAERSKKVGSIRLRMYTPASKEQV